ncbi:hypothetical protein DPEC_G00248060 [Dallia pectoralis]|uniref:Uncharacterized protein n=1 Tax=Dallia pectoralis TaxID=75939 RepID=A0ACC2FWP2_DALPE|nr:hypothetical protein DPEC_G00248060 [Dallia pectoralis]
MTVNICPSLLPTSVQSSHLISMFPGHCQFPYGLSPVHPLQSLCEGNLPLQPCTNICEAQHSFQPPHCWLPDLHQLCNGCYVSKEDMKRLNYLTWLLTETELPACCRPTPRTSRDPGPVWTFGASGRLTHSACLRYHSEDPIVEEPCHAAWNMKRTNSAQRAPWPNERYRRAPVLCLLSLLFSLPFSWIVGVISQGGPGWQLGQVIPLATHPAVAVEEL